MTSRYLEFTKLAVNPSSSSASLTAIGEGKPPMKSGKGYNVNMGLYSGGDNSQSDWTNSIESATGTASPTQPTGKVTPTLTADNDQRLRHLNGVVYDRWGTKTSSETSVPGVSTTSTRPVGAPAANPVNSFESSVADANYTDRSKGYENLTQALDSGEFDGEFRDLLAAEAPEKVTKEQMFGWISKNGAENIVDTGCQFYRTDDDGPCGFQTQCESLLREILDLFVSDNRQTAPGHLEDLELTMFSHLYKVMPAVTWIWAHLGGHWINKEDYTQFSRALGIMIIECVVS